MKRRHRDMFTGRFFITALTILVQIAFLSLVLLVFNDIFVYYYAISFAFSVLLCICVINKKTNSAYKITWIILLLAIPLFGPALYVMLNGDFFRRGRVKKLKSVIVSIKDHLSYDNKIEFDTQNAKLQSEYIRKYSYSPPVKNTTAKYFPSGERYFESVLKDLATAEKSIYIEYFIIKNGYMWDEIKRILIEKAESGVEVKIIYDDVGSIDRISFSDIDELEKHGIKIKAFNPFVPTISAILNNRDHRKICVIDTKIAYSGGVNIGDEYINENSKFGYFKDSGIAIYGEGAYNFEVFFLTLWEAISKEKVTYEKPEYPETDDGIFQPYTDSPIDEEPLGENIYMNIISKAEKYVYISTPYFVVDDGMLNTILNTAKSGVDVRLIVPNIPDKILVNQVTKSYYKRLIDAGVKVYEYKKGFNHSKIVVSDDRVATVGSVNFDYRSFFLSFECGIWMYKTPIINDVLLDFNTMLLDCIQITPKESNVALPVRIFRGILSAFSPLF